MIRQSSLAAWYMTHPDLAAVAANAVFCLVIGLGAGAIFGSYVPSIIVSFLIGMSIHAVSHLAIRLNRDRWPRTLVAAVAIPVGLLAGLTLGGYYLRGDLLLFYEPMARNSLILGLVFGVIGSFGFSTLQMLADTKRELQAQQLITLKQEKELIEAQLRVLQAQMEPHFLFNTLSNIESLMRESGSLTRSPSDSSSPGSEVSRQEDFQQPQQQARAMLQHLTHLLRGSLKRTREANTTLGEELDLVRSYLSIQQIRMGERLQFEINCPTALRQIKLAPYMVQPLVENAVVHGIDAKLSGGKVTIDAATDSTTADRETPAHDEVSAKGYPATKALHIRIVDDGVGLETAPAQASLPRSGVSLSNLQERLRSLYGEHAELRFRPRTPQGTEVNLRIPYQ